MASTARTTRSKTLDEPPVVTTSDPWSLMGEVIGARYRVDGLIGIGGMGSVLRCHHVGLGRDIALKVLHPERSAHAESSARFTREARSASRLDHPNCVRVLDFGEWQQRPGAPVVKYLAMELVEGQELGKMLREPLPLRTAFDFAGQILDGLDHAHERGVVHRDLKPENVIVTRVGTGHEQLKLVDFGIAKIMGGAGIDARMTRTGRVFGTPHYMSPEQVAGSEVDGRADLYAVGVLLYQMISGHLPFDSEDPTVLMGKHLFNEPPPLPSGLPPKLQAVVGKLMAKEPEDRYATAADARADLDAARRELEASLVVPKRSTPWLLRHRGPALMLALMTGAIGAFAWSQLGSEDVVQAGLIDLGSATASVSTPALPEPVFMAMHGATEPDDVARPPVTDARPGSLAQLDTLLDAYPDDAQLHLQRARLLARAGDGARALASYERALARDPALVDEQVVAEIGKLGRERGLRPAALDVVLQELGASGRPLLIEMLADDDAPLGYRDRHRALASLTGTLEAASVDMRRMIALDLQQARSAEQPCAAFAAALDEIGRDPAPAYLRPLRRVTPPRAPRHAGAETRAICAALPSRLVAVRTTVARAAQAGAKTKPSPGPRIARRDDDRRTARAKRSGVGRLRGLAG